MNQRKWAPQPKANIVIQDLKGRAVADICFEHQISQAQYYQWREQFLENLPHVFNSYNNPKRNVDIERAIRTIKEVA